MTVRSEESAWSGEPSSREGARDSLSKRVLVFICDGCGGWARFGRGVNLRKALATGDVSHAGEWTCGPDGCVGVRS